MPFEIGQSEQGAVLYLKDEVTVAEAAEIKKEMAKLIRNNSRLSLDTAQIAELDTSIIQLIFSAFKSARDQGVEMMLTGHSEAFDAAMERTGMAFK